MGSKILIIDDEKIICTGFSRELEAEGFPTEWALNGKDAIDMIEANGFGLAIVDFVLPDMNGVELCRKIKSIDGQMKIIIMSGYTGVFEKFSRDLRLIDKDMPVVYKPFYTSEILHLIKKSFNQE